MKKKCELCEQMFDDEETMFKFDIHDSEIYCVFCFDIMLEMYYEEERMRIGL